MAPHTRPRPNSIELLPEECEGIVAWAAQELAGTRSQTEIYADFRQKLIALQGELGLGFDIPHFSSFNRHAVKLAKLTSRMNRAQRIANAVVTQTEGQDADNLTQAATRMLKTLIVEMMENAGDEGFSPKEATAAAAALYRLAMAENVSTTRRQKLRKEIDTTLQKAVNAASDEVGKEGREVDSMAIIKKIREEVYGIFDE